MRETTAVKVDKLRVSAYPVAVITILFLGCFLYVLNPVWAIVTVIILLQIATGIMLSFNHERFGISNRKKAWSVVGAFALTYLISLCFLIRHEVTGEAISLKLGIGTAALITIFLACLYYSMLKHNNPDQQKLQEMDQHIAETKQQNETDFRANCRNSLSDRSGNEGILQRPTKIDCGKNRIQVFRAGDQDHRLS